MRLSGVLDHVGKRLGKAVRKQKQRRSGFGGKLTNLGYTMMDGKFRHDVNYGRGDNVHNNEFPPIRVNRRPYAPMINKTSPATRKRVDYDMPGPLYLHRWLSTAPDMIGAESSQNWRPRDYIEVDPNIFLKTTKYPRDEMMLNPYLRFPIYNRLPLHYRLMIEEEVVRYDNIINNIGSKRPGEEGEWVLWEKKIREDRERGRIYQKDWKYIQKTANKAETEIVLEPDEAPRTLPLDALGFEDVKFEPVRVNREHIPYEFPRGKDDRRFYHPMKGGRSENIPGRKDNSTEYNYARDSLEELWGGEGVIRGHTFRSRIREYPQGTPEYNVTWWPERRYNHKFMSLLLGEVIQTVTTETCLDQIDQCGGFDEYILFTSPAKLMSDLGCRLKQQMLYTLNDPEKLVENLTAASNIYPHLNPEKMADFYLDKFESVMMTDEAISWINMPLYEALKRQLAIDLDLASRPKETPKLKSERTREGSLQKLLRGEELDEKPSPMPRLSFKSEMNMKKIELELNKERFGARYEFENAIDEFGLEAAAEMINSMAPELEKFRRGFPELRTEEEIKYAEMAAHTKKSKAFC